MVAKYAYPLHDKMEYPITSGNIQSKLSLFVILTRLIRQKRYCYSITNKANSFYLPRYNLASS